MALTVMLIAGLVTGGCDKRTDTAVAAPSREPVRVVATTYAMADVVRAVGGSRVRVEWWVESGQSLAEIAERGRG